MSFRGALGALERLAVSRRGPALLAVAALTVYGVQSIALPLVAGRDAGTYLRYYAQMFEWDSVLPMTALYRTPVAPLVLGVPLDLGGGALLQVVMGCLFAASILAWTAVARRVSARAAVLVALALLLYPGYGILFHGASSDSVFAAAFALWGWLVARGIASPAASRFAAVGAATALCALVRPGNQVLLLVAVVPLLLAAPWRSRIARAAALVAPAIVLLVGWAFLNEARYDDRAVARGTKAYVPFFRALVTDHIVAPENGEASRKLAAAVSQFLLVEEPYRSYGVDLDAFFGQASDRMFEDVLGLSDRAWGWDSDYATLRSVGLEAVRAHPGVYAKGVAGTVWRELWHPLHVALPRRVSPESEAQPAEAEAKADPTPTPQGGELIPAAHQGFYTTTPETRVREVWTSPTAHTLVFDRPGDRARYEALFARESELGGELRPYAGSESLTRWLSRSSKLWPPPVLWLVVGLAGVALRRPRRLALAAVPAAAALAVVVTSALGTYSIIELAVPVAPALVVLGAAGLLGERGIRSPAMGRTR